MATGGIEENSKGGGEGNKMASFLTRLYLLVISHRKNQVHESFNNICFEFLKKDWRAKEVWETVI